MLQTGNLEQIAMARRSFGLELARSKKQVKISAIAPNLTSRAVRTDLFTAGDRTSVVHFQRHTASNAEVHIVTLTTTCTRIIRFRSQSF